MAKKNIKTTGDLESRITILETRLSALEQLSKKFTRKKREYTDEQKAAIRARLLGGQEKTLKRREHDDVEVSSVGKQVTATKKVVKRKPVQPPKQS